MSDALSAPHPSLAARCRWTIDLVRVLTPREIRSRYRQSVLDIAWALISPISVLIVYGIVLTQSFRVSGDGAPYLSLAWTGLVLWTFFASALSSAASSLISAHDLLTKVFFPKEALPLSMVGASLADLGIGLLTVAVLLPVQGVHPTRWAPLALLPIVVLVVWAAAICVLTAVIGAFVRDIPHLVQLFVRVGFFATPVMYDENRLPHALHWTATVSPIAVAIDGFRSALLFGRRPDLTLLVVHLVLGAVLLWLSVLYTRAVESRVTDVV